MAYYDLDSPHKFIRGGIDHYISRSGCKKKKISYFVIVVCELDTQNPCNATISDFSEIERVVCTGFLPLFRFNGLKVRGFFIEGTNLTTLAENLIKANLMVNNEGFGYFQTKGRVHKKVSRRIDFYRINELFDWPSHGVLLPQDPETKWDRCIFGRREAKINYPLMENELKDCQTKKKNKETKLKAKEKEIGDAKDELKAIENELINTKAKIGMKDKEIRDKQTEIDMLIAKLQRMQQSIPSSV